MTKRLSTVHYAPASFEETGWKNNSTPIGNGYLGAVIFGGISREAIQLTDKTLCFHNATLNDKRHNAGVENFGYVYVDFEHGEDEVSDYTRELCLNDGICTVSYNHSGNRITRKYFASYPDKCLVMRIDSELPLTLDFSAQIAFLREYCMEQNTHTAKTGEVIYETNQIIMKGNSEYYNVDFEGIFRIIPQNGELELHGNKIRVLNTTGVTLVGSLGTNYRLHEKVTLEPDRLKKLEGFEHPHSRIDTIVKKAGSKTCCELEKNHTDDFSGIFNRVTFDIGGKADKRSTPELIQSYKNGNEEKYLEELFFQYGRYMSISTSRKGGLPSSLCGGWNADLLAPWKGGYWYNINQQINYWHVFSANMAEMFEAYNDFNRARLKAMQKIASESIKEIFPEKYSEGEGANGWYVGTANTPYEISSLRAHSGPGTGGLTTSAYIDYYEYICSNEALKVVYPMLEGMARFYLKFVEKTDGKYLAVQSASPEQMHNGRYYSTVGCAFDQQMIYNNNFNLIKIFEENKHRISDYDEELLRQVKEQIDCYDPVIIGKSGQIKEFREEEYYGDIGEKNHRHISNLTGLYPGTFINDSTPAWLDAARTTLRFRGPDAGKGWSQAHYLNLCARCGDAKGAYQHIRRMIRYHLFDNMWNKHDSCVNLDCCVFQADGNFGACAGVCEMLCQSGSGYIKLLPALPPEWSCGAVSGIVARGNFIVSMRWTDGCVEELSITSNAGKKARICYPGIACADVYCCGNKIDFKAVSGDCIEFDTLKGNEYTFCNMAHFSVTPDVENLKLSEENGKAVLKWNEISCGTYRIQRALESSPDYEIFADNLTDASYELPSEQRQYTYKVTAIQNGKIRGNGETLTVCPGDRACNSMSDNTVMRVLDYKFFNPESDADFILDGKAETFWSSSPVKFNESNPWFILDLGTSSRVKSVSFESCNLTDRPVYAAIYISDEPDMFAQSPSFEGCVKYNSSHSLLSEQLSLKKATGRYMKIEILGISQKRDNDYYLSLRNINIVR